MRAASAAPTRGNRSISSMDARSMSIGTVTVLPPA
jgi:hypothetical protein